MTQPYGPGYPQPPQQPGQVPGRPVIPPPSPQAMPGSFPYQQPAYAMPVVVMKPDAPSASTAQILGIVGMIGSFFTCLLGLIGIGGIIYAKKAEEEIARSGGTLGGEDKAKVGRITGWIGVVVASLPILYLVGWLVVVVLIGGLLAGSAGLS